jgi:DNA-binding IclR family transcriptional regulator
MVRYQLGLAFASCSGEVVSRSVSKLVLPYVRKLLERFRETVNLGILRDGQVLYTEMLESPPFLLQAEVDAIIGPQSLAALTSHTITSLTASKREIVRTRTRGRSRDSGETESGVCCFGAPILAIPKAHRLGR